MKNRRSDVLLALCGVLVWLLADGEAVRAGAAEALALCARSVVPALFPFFAVSSLLISMGFGQWAGPLFSGLMALFRLPGAAGSALALGLVGGYPVGARTAADLYRRGLLTRDEARRLLTFCSNSNPVFFLSVLGRGVFHSGRVGVWLWLIHLLCALLTGLLLGRREGGEGRRSPRPAPAAEEARFFSALVSAIRRGAEDMVHVCGFVVFFYVLTRPLLAIGGRAAAALVGLTELFSLTPLLAPDRFGLVLAAAASGWGGLSVACQTAAALEGSGLPVGPCLGGKAVQGALSALLAAALSGYILEP